MLVNGIIEEVSQCECGGIPGYKFLVYDLNDYKRIFKVVGEKAKCLINSLLVLADGTSVSDIEGMIVVLEVNDDGYVEYTYPISTTLYNEKMKRRDSMIDIQDLKNEIKFDTMVISGLKDSVKIKKRRISELEKEIRNLKNELDNTQTLLDREKTNKDKWRAYALVKYKERKGAQS